MHRISVIALNTYREAVRARILHGLFGLAIATGAYSLVVGAYALQEQLRVVSDLGAASASLYAVFVAVILGATSLYRELELKTIFPILARPLHRAEYLVGKYFGTLLTLAVFVAAYTGLLLLALGTLAGRGLGSTVVAPLSLLLLSVALGWRLPRLRTWLPIPVAALLLIWGALQSVDAPDDRRVLLGAGLLTFLEVCIVCALATVFASFSSPFLTALFTLGLVVLGRSADTLARLPERVFGAVIKRIAGVLSDVLPNLMAYVPPRTLLTGEATGVSYWPYTGAAAVQALAWSVGLLALSALIFRRRDFL